MTGIQTIPKCDMDSFARWVAKATIAYFEDPDVRRRFEEWKKEREKKLREEEPLGASETGGQG